MREMCIYALICIQLERNNDVNAKEEDLCSKIQKNNLPPAFSNIRVWHCSMASIYFCIFSPWDHLEAKFETAKPIKMLSWYDRSDPNGKFSPDHSVVPTSIAWTIVVGVIWNIAFWSRVLALSFSLLYN